MKQHMLTLFFAVLLLAFQSCHKISGNGPTITRNISTPDFTSVDAGIDGDVYFTQDNNYKVEIQAQSNILDLIETPVVNGELRIQFKKFANLGRHDRVIVHITAPNVNGLGINGSGTLRVQQAINSGNMALKVNGSGNISIASYTGNDLTANISGSGRINVEGGSVKTESLRISGSGDIDLLDLSALDVTTNTSGSGNTSVNVSEYLDVHISGSGNVFYTGYPSVNSSISGSGKLTHL